MEVGLRHVLLVEVGLWCSPVSVLSVVVPDGMLVLASFRLRALLVVLHLQIIRISSPSYVAALCNRPGPHISARDPMPMAVAVPIAWSLKSLLALVVDLVVVVGRLVVHRMLVVVLVVVVLVVVVVVLMGVNLVPIVVVVQVVVLLVILVVVLVEVVLVVAFPVLVLLLARKISMTSLYCSRWWCSLYWCWMAYHGHRAHTGESTLRGRSLATPIGRLKNSTGPCWPIGSSPPWSGPTVQRFESPHKRSSFRSRRSLPTMA